jgi:integrase
VTKQYKLETYRWPDGERFCHLLDAEIGLPHQPSLLYVTAKIRNKGLSLSAMQSAFNAIHTLLIHFQQKNISIEQRFKSGAWLSPFECDHLRQAAQAHMGPGTKAASSVVSLTAGKRGYKPATKKVASATTYTRLTEMANYLQWLAEDLGGPAMNSEQIFEIERMRANILKLRPSVRSLANDPEQSAWSDQDDALLHEIIIPGSPRNPFIDTGTQIRNYLAIQIMRCTGKRKSEVLNIQARDIDTRRQQLSIVRRPDSNLDPRLDQPRVKTREHTISVATAVIDLYQNYLVHRRAIPGANKHPYLLVNHKAGPTQGQPMTKGALEEVFRTIKKSEPQLHHLHPHLLRYHFNDKLSEAFDQQTGERNEDEEAKIRANLNGWSEQSNMAKVYNKRHIGRKAREVGLRTQDALTQVMNQNDQRKGNAT